MFMFVRFVHHNIPDRQDLPWIKGIVEVLKGNEHKVADVGKYNAGQKMMFWTIMSMISLLLATGVIIWRPYFAHFFPHLDDPLEPFGACNVGDRPDTRHSGAYVHGVLGERLNQRDD